MRIRAADYRAMAWKNGQGMTREIAREPGDGDFLWRLSIAEVAASGDFSLRFVGQSRNVNRGVIIAWFVVRCNVSVGA